MSWTTGVSARTVLTPPRLPRHGGVATRGSDVAEDSTHTGLTRMSDYEAKAWQAAINALERKSSRRRLPRRLRKVGSQAQELSLIHI